MPGLNGGEYEPSKDVALLESLGIGIPENTLGGEDEENFTLPLPTQALTAKWIAEIEETLS